jgi:hypothetical protein
MLSCGVGRRNRLGGNFESMDREDSLLTALFRSVVSCALVPMIGTDRTRRFVATAIVLSCCWLAVTGAIADEVADEAFFEAKIRPVLAETCFRCHGGERTGGQLRVDGRETLLKGGETSAAIVPGKPDESLLVQAIRRQADVSAMPPDRPLRPDQVDDFVKWVSDGAHWPKATAKFEFHKHWAFEPVSESSLPEVKDKAFVRTSVDAFIRHAQEQAGVAPTSQADRRALIRRVTYSITGLPPSEAEVAAFLADTDPNAFEKVVDRLLQSPQYGEHWGRHWLDVVRYADTAGENSDHPLPHAWKYRNWVIDAFNADKPYDEFVREQIAGDLLADAGPPEKFASRTIATGYLAISRRFGHDIDKDMHLTFEDTIDTLGKSILGLSVACARCHDHKFDPLSSRDYYGLYGILASTRFSYPGCEPNQQPRDLVPLMPRSEYVRIVSPRLDEIAKIDGELNRLKTESTQAAAEVQKSLSTRQTLSAGEIADSSAADVTAAEGARLDDIAVELGDILLLSITPRANHGADSTLVELTIAESAGAGRVWSTKDLVQRLDASNPRPDPFGNPAVWWFVDPRKGFDLLGEKVLAINGRPELQAWRNGETPSVFANSSANPVPVWTTLPAQSFFMHPGPDGPVALAWVAPAKATVSLKARIADAHPGGDGVGWIIERIQPAVGGASLAKLTETRETIAQLSARRKEVEAEAVVPVAYAVQDGQPANSRIHKRGEPDNLGDEAPRKFLDILGGEALHQPTQSGRLELADWLTSPKNPLTSRVIVNRVWQWHFGRGLVKTPNDFGTRGSPPTHPALLDHLATGLIRNGWSLKWLHREILLSSTWQLDSRLGADAADLANLPALVDAYAVFPRRRLNADELRDTLLLCSEELDLTPGEEHPFPPTTGWSFTQHAPFAAEYETNRRSVYVMQKRNRRLRFFSLFDGPDPNTSTPVRDNTIVPTQALFFLNDPFVHARAKVIATLLPAGSDADRVNALHRRLFSRPATPDDQADFEAFKAITAGREAWEPYVRVLLCSNETLYVD